MLNLLGEADGKAGMDALNDVCRRSLSCPGATAHWFDIPPSKSLALDT